MRSWSPDQRPWPGRKATTGATRFVGKAQTCVSSEEGARRGRELRASVDVLNIEQNRVLDRGFDEGWFEGSVVPFWRYDVELEMYGVQRSESRLITITLHVMEYRGAEYRHIWVAD